MSTSAIISVKQEDGKYKSILVRNDGYIQNPGVGYLLSSYYYSPKTINKLIEAGSIDSLLSHPNDYSSGDGVELMSTVKEILEYCVKNQINYLYVYEDDIWQWTGIDEKEFKLVELRMSDTMETVSRDKIDVPRYCSYKTAISWVGTNIVLLNNIQEIDPDFDPYSDFYEDSDDEEDEEDEEYPEFYQFYITDLSDNDVEWMNKVFPDLTLSYSELLNSWILCVSHYGTSWDYVPTEYIGHINISKEEFDRFNKK